MKKLLSTLSLLTLAIFTTQANETWQQVDNTTTITEGVKHLFPVKYITYKLDDNYLKNELSAIYSSGGELSIYLPAPDGSFKNFVVTAAPVMAPELAAKFPEIMNFNGIGIGDKPVKAKLNYTQYGLDVMVYDGVNTYFIDPATNSNTGYYVCYYKNDYQRRSKLAHECHVSKASSELTDEEQINLNDGNDLPINTFKTNGSNRITYRLALTCTGEYAKAVDGPNPQQANVLAAMTKTLTRVNGILEKEVGSSMQLVSGNNQLIYLDPATDPFTSAQNSTVGNGTQTANQNNTDQVIGNLNYDIGHIFCSGNGGIADYQALCDGGFKARGATGSPNPVGDPFDVDFVVHEIGHQYGAEHTFNSGSNSCSGNGAANAAYEPGSGSTIMAYAGLCSPDDIQNNSNDYFHYKSLDQMINYITNPALLLCGTSASANNNPPSVANIAATYDIPKSTFFELEAPQAMDSDHDVLTYCWEEYDLGDYTKTFANTLVGPIFRSFPPTTDRWRVFPVLDSVRNNVKDYLGEKLPTVSRTMKFKLTVRDEKNGFGTTNMSDNEVTLNVTDASGPFTVKAPDNGQEYWQIGQTYTVQWDVANTTAAPVSCSNVDIYLSLDDGRTYPITLLTNTPNDGSETITVPANTMTSQARVKVKGNGNVFFDISNNGFTIDLWPQSIGNVSFENDVKVFPVPASETIHISIDNNNTYSALLLNNIGQTIWTADFSNTADIDVRTIPSGIYQLAITQENTNEKMIKKIIVQH